MGGVTRVPIGDRIRNQRRHKGLTQRDLASAVGVSPAYLSLIESDKRQIGGRLLNRIAEQLELSTDAFTAASDDRLAADLDELSRGVAQEIQPGAAELVAFSPEWARVILSLHERALTAEARADRLTERFQRDPQSISFAHDILSRITSIRSGAEILSEHPEMEGDHRQRFTETIVSESARLSTVARQMIGSLDAGATADAAGADVRDADAFLQDRGYHFPTIEETVAALQLEPPQPNGRDRFAATRALVAEALRPVIEDELGARAFRSEGARRRAHGALERYAAGALLMPYDAFRSEAERLRFDVDLLCERFGVSFEQAAHRLASLKRPGAEGPPFAFLRVDPAGTVSKRLSTPYFRLPLFGACALWVVFDAFSQPGRTLSQMVDLDGERFLLVARALEKTKRRQAQPGARFAVMLAVPESAASGIVYADPFTSRAQSVITFAGYECRSCRRLDCAQRAHGQASVQVQAPA
ncbi:MAG: short-chain fatty acyl-CoA regulator family protein [Pseudomonadota bacterium]